MARCRFEWKTLYYFEYFLCFKFTNKYYTRDVVETYKKLEQAL